MKVANRFKILGSLLITATATFFSSTSLAQGPEFEKRKAERLARLDQQIQKLQEHRACVNAAASHEAMRKCGDEMREWHKGEYDQRKKARGN